MTLEDARKIVAKISDTLDEDAKVIWGAQILDDLEKVIRTMVVITGVRSDQIRGSSKKKESERRNVDEELGLEFIR